MVARCDGDLHPRSPSPDQHRPNAPADDPHRQMDSVGANPLAPTTPSRFAAAAWNRARLRRHLVSRLRRRRARGHLPGAPGDRPSDGRAAQIGGSRGPCLWDFRARLGDQPVIEPTRCTWVPERRDADWVMVHWHKSVGAPTDRVSRGAPRVPTGLLLRSRDLKRTGRLGPFASGPMPDRRSQSAAGGRL